ncbi:MAG: hypothetical protein WCE54_02675 [Ignavibacteriaceae bacterium]
MPETELLGLCKFYFIPVFLLSLSSILYCQKYPDKNVDSLLNRGINFIINQKYESAGNIFEELNNAYPNLPFGKIYLAAAEIAKSYDYNQKFNDESITKYLKSAINEADSLLDDNDQNVWNIYFAALSKGYYAYYQALNRNWLSAVSNGFDAVKYFQKCLDKDSLFYDAYTAIGNFEYWKSRKAGWLPFVSDNSSEGIRYIMKAVNNQGYNNYLAVHSLQWIYIDQKKYNDVIKLSKPVVEKYPESRFFKWALARAYEEIDKKEAVKIYYEILNSYLKINELSKFHEILLKHLIAQQYAQMGELNEALTLCNEILTINYDSSWNKNRLDRRIERVNELKKKILIEMGK